MLLTKKIVKLPSQIFLYPSRKYSSHLIITSGIINFFALTQLWNPYFPRNKLININYIGIIFLIAGIIYPS